MEKEVKRGERERVNKREGERNRICWEGGREESTVKKGERMRRKRRSEREERLKKSSQRFSRYTLGHACKAVKQCTNKPRASH